METIYWPGDDHALAKTTLFLGWYGVIGDPEKTSRNYKKVMASLLKARFGGDFHKWIRSRSVAFEWYVNEWQSWHESRKRTKLEPTAKAPAKEETDVLEDKVFTVGKELDFEIACRIQATYPEVEKVLADLHENGIGLFATSCTSSNHLKGLLRGSGLVDYFRGSFTPDETGYLKEDVRYWRNTFKSIGCEAKECVVVEATPSRSKAAEDSGALSILMKRGRTKSDFSGHVLRRFSDLPGLLEKVAKEKRD